MQLFKHVDKQPGTVENLVRLYNEMRRYCLNSSAIRIFLSQRCGNSFLLRDKLADLAIIMEDMEQKMEGIIWTEKGACPSDQ